MEKERSEVYEEVLKDRLRKSGKLPLILITKTWNFVWEDVVRKLFKR